MNQNLPAQNPARSVSGTECDWLAYLAKELHGEHLGAMQGANLNDPHLQFLHGPTGTLLHQLRSGDVCSAEL